MRYLSARDALPVKVFWEAFQKAGNERDKALVAILYLTGARISEAIKLTLDNVRIEEDEDGRRWLLFEVETLKRKDHPVRALPIPLDHRDSRVKEMVQFLVSYFKGLAEKGCPWLLPDLRSFQKPITRKYAWKILKHLDERLFPHLFRHSRLSHLARKASPFQLQKIAGWKDIRMAERYVHLYSEDLKGVEA